MAALAVVLSSVLVFPQWLISWELGSRVQMLSAADLAKTINDVRATLLQGVGGAVILLGAYFTYRQLQTGREQLQIAQQGQVTERFTRAVDQLGNAELDIRLGGIYALERIANDSPADRAAIAEILTAFIRGHAPWPPRLPDQPATDVPINKLPELQSRAADVQVALTVLGRRQALPEPIGHLDLRGTDLRRANLVLARLPGVFLDGANLQGATLRHAHLQGAYLCNAHLQGADLSDAHLRQAEVIFRGTRYVLPEADLAGATADRRTVWPDSFAWKAAGIVMDGDSEPVETASAASREGPRCRRCQESTEQCPVCKGSGKVWGMFGDCTECDSTGWVCSRDGKYWK